MHEIPYPISPGGMIQIRHNKATLSESVSKGAGITICNTWKMLTLATLEN